MKKENRKMAQQRRALEKKKQQQKKLIKTILLIAIPLILIAAGLWAVSMISNKDTSADNSTTSASDLPVEEYDTSLPTLSTDPDRVVQDGDTVNIDYVGTVDGVEFAGGNTGGMGADLTIGSQMYIDDFEQQLIGYKAGDTVEVVVTFPENYGVEELNGKEAVFTTVINGIYDVY